ncbi:uncharacterized protein LOC108931892 isoform X2 [Scleropages formosus]|uniref:uncharacterized protein LOC108931892 isoform X2 n=1 Tax=Scleropages formosus TaxID=113540 RepID=UPI0010FAC8B7|nr:uncharacterized protein LOC108931892 isoform X2 [Scleropages formosus]
MDVCVKSEPEDEHISHPEYCPEVQGFSAEEMGSRLHLDIDRIKTEIVTVKIMEDNTHLQLCSTTKVLCTPLEQLNSPVSLSSKQYKSETEEVKVEQHSKFQKTSWAVKDITEAAHCIKDEWKELKVNEGSSVPCPLSKQCKSETDEVKVERHSQLQGSSSPDSQINNFAIHSVKEECMNLHVNEFRSVPCSLSVQCKLERSAVKKEQHSQLQAFSCTELEINNSANHSLMERCPDVQVAHELSQNNSEKLENCAIIAGADVQTKGAVEQSGGCVTSTVIHKATEQPRHDGVTCSAQKWQFLED